MTFLHRILAIGAATLVGMGWLAGTASAQTSKITVQGTLIVGASINASCSVTGESLSFGTIIPGATDATKVSGTLQVQCTTGTAYAVKLNAGTNPNGTTRRMKHATTNNFIEYLVTRDQAGAQEWGSDTTNMVTGTGNGLQQSIPVHASVKVPADAVLPPGSYEDRITISVEY